MILQRSIIILIFLLSSHLAHGFLKESVRVRLVKDLKTVNLSGVNLRFQQNGKIDPYERVAIPRLSTAKVVLSQLKTSAQPFWKVKTSEKSGDFLKVYSDVLYIHGHRIKVGLEPVPSRIRLERNRRGKIDVITELDIESYLAGVLPSEMPASWPIEALKAQAIASRTYMRKKMSERSHIHFDLEASVHDQVFKAMSLKDENPVFQKKIEEALLETEGMVLKNKRGDYLTAYYHSDCGGKTESPVEVWGMDGHDHQMVNDRYCKGRTASKWRASFLEDELARKLARHFKIYSEPKLNSLFVSRRSVGDRNGDLSVMFEGHLPKTMKAQEFRAALGFDKIKSTRFDWKQVDGTYRFHGEGNGHGVGLCQWGSRQLALTGRGFKKILKHYYPKAKLVKEKDPVRVDDLLAVPMLSKDRIRGDKLKKLKSKAL